MKAVLKAIEYHLPKQILTNSQLSAEHPEWDIEANEMKTGIRQRHIAAEGECSSDLGVAAAKKLFAKNICKPDDIDCLLFCTQSPDYFLPTTACILQDRLGIPSSSAALDFNLGCSGYIYGLGLAKGLIETQQAKNVLLITAETYSKYIHPDDRSVRTLFGDAAAATLIKMEKNNKGPDSSIGPFVYGTDGSGAKNLIVQTGGMRSQKTCHPAKEIKDQNGNVRSEDDLYMNGSEIFTFTLQSVPKAVKKLLLKAERHIEDIDLFVFHQANKFMLSHLMKKIKIPEEKFYLAYEKVGNTVSSSIPIALKEAFNDGSIKPGCCVMLVGFGVGYSWGATLVNF